MPGNDRHSFIGFYFYAKLYKKLDSTYSYSWKYAVTEHISCKLFLDKSNLIPNLFYCLSHSSYNYLNNLLHTLNPLLKRL